MGAANVGDGPFAGVVERRNVARANQVALLADVAVNIEHAFTLTALIVKNNRWFLTVIL